MRVRFILLSAAFLLVFLPAFFKFFAHPQSSYKAPGECCKRINSASYLWRDWSNNDDDNGK